MCFNCNCPQPVPPPTQTLAKCRKYLQILAAALLLIGAVGLACGQIMQFLFSFLLIYFLYIGWTTFNWCMVLGFFMFCTMQSVQSIILFVGILQYGQFFTKGYFLVSLYCLMQILYYPAAVFVSHYCYKHFKHNFQGNNQLFMGGPGRNNGGGQQVGGGMGGRLDEQPQQARANANNNTNQFFRGQGVRIG